MKRNESRLRSWTTISMLAVAFVVFIGIPEVQASAEFSRYLAFVDKSLRSNPNHVHPMALASCQDRRNHASWLNSRGYDVRAVRSLRYCFSLLGLSEADMDEAPDPKAAERRLAKATAGRRAAAMAENQTAETLTPDLANGLEIYRDCAACHLPEGWGMSSGMVPQLAGQHRTVITKQLADIRAGYRKNRIMAPYATVESIGGPQAVADVAAYIDTLEMTTQNGKGPGTDLDLGRTLYQKNCVQCHGAQGEGNAETRIPRIQSQHFGYLVMQFQLIRDGDRSNADPKMVEQIKDFDERQIDAVMDYVSRLEPPEEMRAQPDWRNPDFMLPRAAK